MSRQGQAAPAQNGAGPGVTHRLQLTVTLVLLALVSITAASYAWFSLAASTRVHSMNMEITTGLSLKMDTIEHAAFDSYQKTLSYTNIVDQMRSTLGFDATQTGLEPVTSTGGTAFATEKGLEVPASKGAYLTFTLHFMANSAMQVHLTSDNSDAGEDGTLVTATGAGAQALRISFTADGVTRIYQPVKSTNVAGQTTFTLAAAGQMSYDDSNKLFSFSENTDMPVVVRVWLEGADPACTDDLRSTDFSLRLRFVGTDENGNVIS